MHRNRGFSLTELLVVVAIIGILTAATLTSLQSARERSRDARRMSDMRNIQNALGLYQANNQGLYPSSTLITIDGTDTLSLALEGDSLISDTPLDPLYPTYTYQYVATTTTSYRLIFCLETDQYEGLGFQQGCGNQVIQ